MDTDVLAELIDAKFAVLHQLRQLADQQAEVIEQGDMTRILSVLAIKQRLLNTLEQVEHRLDRFREQDPELRVWRTPEHRQRTREASARCDLLLKEIIAVERDCETRLTLRRDQAADRIRAAHFSTYATRAYQSAGDLSGGQFDASCET